MRADQWLVAHHYVTSRQKAKELIETGAVFADGTPLKKASQTLQHGVQIHIDSPLQNWVSRGALKLVGAFDIFSEVSAKDKICLDLGASTGGFSQVLLAKGAAKIYAVDVGHGQLAAPLLADRRIINLEKTNARMLSHEDIPEPVSLIVCDLSFISLKKALPAALAMAPLGCHIIALIKPQFEVGRAGLAKGGIVKDEALRQQVVTDYQSWFAGEGWRVLGTADSPITGPDGNHEYLLAALKKG